MASDTFVRAVAPDLSCPVCLEMFRAPHIPKDLPDCGHVCCEVCLTDLVNQNRRACPECRKDITVPQGGVSMLRTNFKIRNLAEKYPKRPREVNDVEEPICVEHDDAKMRHFCASCNMLACQLCLLMNHKGEGHETKKVTERYQELQALTNECQKVVDDCGYQKIKSRVETKVSKQLNDVDELMKDRIKQIRNIGKDMKSQISATKTLLLKELDKEIANHTKLIDSVAKLQSGAKESAGNIPEADYVLRYNSLQQKLETFKAESSQFEASLSPISAVHVLPQIKPPILWVGDMEQMLRGGKDNDREANTTFGFKFQNVISRIKNGCKRIYSPPFVFKDIAWKMYLTKNVQEGEDFDLGFYVGLHGPYTRSCQVSLILKIVGQDEGANKQVHSNRMIFKFCKERNNRGFRYFIRSQDFRMYLKDDSVVGLVEILSAEVEEECKK